MIDLGAWADEQYTIPGEALSTLEDDIDTELKRIK